MNLFYKLTTNAVNVNSLSYIQNRSLNYSIDVSGTSSNNGVSYGINPNNENLSYLRIKNGSVLATSAGFGNNFTIYTKHACRFDTGPILGHGSVVVPSSNVLTSKTLQIRYYSLFTNPVSYNISGVLTSDISNAVTSGTINGNYQLFNYNITAPARRVLKFSVGTASASVVIPSQIYTVTVAGGKYSLALNGATVPMQSINFNTGNLYVFNQSDSSNKGNTLVIGNSIDNPTYTGTVSGTSGSSNAYTLLDLSGITLTSPLYYYSSNYPGLGTPPIILSYSGGISSAENGTFPDSTNNFNYPLNYGTKTSHYNNTYTAVNDEVFRISSDVFYCEVSGRAAKNNNGVVINATNAAKDYSLKKDIALLFSYTGDPLITYTYSASPQANLRNADITPPSDYPFNSFGYFNEYWINTNTGVVTSTQGYDLNKNETNFGGDWVDVEFPYYFLLSNVSFYPRGYYYSRAPTKVRILGSLNTGSKSDITARWCLVTDSTISYSDTFTGVNNFCKNKTVGRLSVPQTPIKIFKSFRFIFYENAANQNANFRNLILTGTKYTNVTDPNTL